MPSDAIVSLPDRVLDAAATIAAGAVGPLAALVLAVVLVGVVVRVIRGLA